MHRENSAHCTARILTIALRVCEIEDAVLSIDGWKKVIAAKRQDSGRVRAQQVELGQRCNGSIFLVHVCSTCVAHAEGDSIQSRCDAWNQSVLPPGNAREARIARVSSYSSKHHHVQARLSLAHHKQKLNKSSPHVRHFSQGAHSQSWHAGTNVRQSVTTEVGFERQRTHRSPALMVSRTLPFVDDDVYYIRQNLALSGHLSTVSGCEKRHAHCDI